ncbi:MAG TPA: heat-inducible transcriptional repressor HrcA, partial [Stenotrophomonas sp.]|nr:heat-inducible transcriptional repressor HrcA [Stenotrophomonas sp.]
KRMAYDRMIPLVQATAEVLGAALEPGGPGGLSRERA